MYAQRAEEHAGECGPQPETSDNCENIRAAWRKASKLRYDTYMAFRKAKLASGRASYDLDPDAKKAKSKAQYQANPEPKEAKSKARSKAQYQANPEPKKAKSRAQYQANPEPKKASATGLGYMTRYIAQILYSDWFE